MAAMAIVRSCSSLHLQLTFEAETLRPFRFAGCSQPLGLCRNIRSGNPLNGFDIRENGRPGISSLIFSAPAPNVAGFVMQLR